MITEACRASGHTSTGSRTRSWRTVEAAGVEAERDVGHRRTQPLAGEDYIVDRWRRRKNAGEERVQRAAIIYVVRAGAAIRMQASVLTMAISAMGSGVVAISVVVTDMRNGGAGNRVGLRQRRRDDAGKLGKHEQRDQCADKARYRPEPLHRSFARDHWATKAGRSLRVSGSLVNPKRKTDPTVQPRALQRRLPVTWAGSGGDQGHHR
jgi:hypothetical protein